MPKGQKTSLEKDYLHLGPAYDGTDTGPEKKTPSWVNLAQLDGPLDDALMNNLAYKPAIRFHGFGGGLWGQSLSDTPSVMTDSLPPSYNHVESMKNRGESCSTCDQGSTLNATTNLSGVSPLTLRRRNTAAVVLVAIGLLAAVAAITGLILHFLHPRAMMRANVRFTIDNYNFTDDMLNSSSLHSNNISRPLCKEMDAYFLTSELADFYLGCKVVSLRDPQTGHGIAVHHTLDFIENEVTRDSDRIKDIILRKSGRLKTARDLYLVVKDFNIHLKSLRVDLEKVSLPSDHPSRNRPRIPWRDDFIPRKLQPTSTHPVTNSILTDNVSTQLTRDVLSNVNVTRNRITTNKPSDILLSMNESGIKPKILSEANGERDTINSISHTPKVTIATTTEIELTRDASTHLDTTQNQSNTIIKIRMDLAPTNKATLVGEELTSSNYTNNYINTTQNISKDTVVPVKGVTLPNMLSEVNNTFYPHNSINSIQQDVLAPVKGIVDSKLVHVSSMYAYPHVVTSSTVALSQDSYVYSGNISHVSGGNTKPNINIKAALSPNSENTTRLSTPEIPGANLKRGDGLQIYPTKAPNTTIRTTENQLVRANFDRENLSNRNNAKATLLLEDANDKLLKAAEKGKILDSSGMQTHTLSVQYRPITFEEEPDQSSLAGSSMQNSAAYQSNANASEKTVIFPTKTFHEQSLITHTLGIELSPNLREYQADHGIMAQKINNKDRLNVSMTQRQTKKTNDYIVEFEGQNAMSGSTQTRSLSKKRDTLKEKNTKYIDPADSMNVNVPLEASFSDINDFVYTDHTATPFLSSITGYTDDSLFDNKVMTLHSGTFLIRGTASSPAISDSSSTFSKKNKLKIPLSFELFSDVPPKDRNSVFVEMKANKGSVKKDMAADIDKLNIPKLVMKSVPPVKIHFSLAPKLIENPQYVDFNNQPILVKTSAVYPADTSSTSEIIRLAEAEPPRLREVIDVPIKEIPLKKENIEWINIFNQHIGDVFAGTVDNMTLGIDNMDVPVDDLTFDNKRNDNNLRHSHFGDGFLQQNTSSVLNGLAADHETKVLKFFDKLMGNKISTGTAIGNFNKKGPSSFRFGRAQAASNPFDMTYFPKHSNMQTQVSTPGNIFHRHAIASNGRSQIPSRPNKPVISNFPHKVTSINDILEQHIPVPSSIPDTTQQQNVPLFNLRQGVYRGRPALLLARAGSGSDNQNPWNFRSDTGFDSSSNNVNSFHSFSFASNAKTNINRQHTARTYLIRAGNTGYGLNQIINWDNHHAPRVSTRKFRVYVPKRPVPRMPVRFIEGLPVFRLAINQGYPGYPEFDDMQMMKQVLEQLVSNMVNMTERLDTMQHTIDYINKTFHETHEPMFKLDETLWNMTVSLDNFNQNLGNINRTLWGFKEYLKNFNSSMFNIEDVVTHIDDSVNTLGKAARYVEYSVMDLNGTTLGVVGDLIDLETALTFMNKSVADVSYSTAYSNETLNAIIETLASLDDVVLKLQNKVSGVVDGSDIISISLKDINSTVINTHGKLSTLRMKLQDVNENMIDISKSVRRLNNTYQTMNKTLESMNEPFVFVNGTVLEVIHSLASMDSKIQMINETILKLNRNTTNMNESLLESMEWLGNMANTLLDFNLKFDNDSKHVTMSLKNKDLIDTIGVLIQMNGTLNEIGSDVEDINHDLDGMDQKINGLSKGLNKLDEKLKNIDTAFKVMNTTIQMANTTLEETSHSLKNINITINNASKTTADLDLSYRNIAETFNVVNKTLSSINNKASSTEQDIQSLNKTFTNLIDSSKAASNMAKRLQLTLSTVTGSSTDLNSKLYNANESLRILSSNSKIRESVLNISTQTLQTQQDIAAELLSKLEDVSTTMEKTNSSLSSLKQSMLTIKQTYVDMSERLNELNNSFTSMRHDLKGIGPAFPNMVILINETKKAMDFLQGEIDDINVDLALNDDRHIGLQETFEKLIDVLQQTKNNVTKIVYTLDTMKQLSHKATDVVSELVRNVDNTTRLYDDIEKNIRYINVTHDQLLNSYQKLQTRQSMANHEVDNTHSIINMLDKRFNDSLESLKNYSKLETPLESLKAEFDDKVSVLNDLLLVYASTGGDFENVDGLLWNMNGDPNSVFEPFETLVNHSDIVNRTINNMTDILEEISDVMTFFETYSPIAETAIERTLLVEKLIDDIFKSQNDVNKKSLKMNSTLNMSNRKINEKITTMKTQLDAIERLNATYGDVNGTVQPDIYSHLKDDILKEIVKLENLKGNLSNITASLEGNMSNFNNTYSSFINETIDITSDSEKLLRRILNIYLNTDASLSDVNAMLEDTTQLINTTDTSTPDLLVRVKDLESQIKYKSAKNSYVTDVQPVISSKFNLTLNHMNKTLADQVELISIIDSLIGRAVAIDRKEKDEKILQNVDLGVEVELNKLQSLKERLRSMSEHSKSELNQLESNYNKFLQMNEHSRELEEIKELYNLYNTELELFQQGLDKDVTSVAEIELSVNATLNSLDDLERMIEYITKTHEFANQTEFMLTDLFRNISTVDGLLTNASERLQSLTEEFNTIQHNYTNFTSTDIDLSSSYVHEALKDNHKLIQTLQIAFNESNISALRAVDKFKTTYSILANQQLDRNNADQVISKELLPPFTDIARNADTIQSQLIEITNKLNTMLFSIEGVNETIHETNEKLFNDRQKQLLADTIFPTLEQIHQTILYSLNETELSLVGSQKKIESAFEAQKRLDARLKEFPSTKISINESMNELLKLNNSLRNAFKKLQHITSQATIANQIVWTDGDRYSPQETITDIKNRYSDAKSLFDEILKEIENLDNDSIQIGNQIISVRNDIEHTNNSLTVLEQLKTTLDRLESAISDISSHYINTSAEADGMIFNITKADKGLNSLLHNFNHIDSSVITNEIVPFEKLLSDTNKSVNSLSSELNLLNKDILKTKDMLNATLGIRDAIVNDSMGLDIKLKETSTMVTTLENRIQTIKEDLKLSTNNADTVSKLVNRLDPELNQLRHIFEQQEKKEYIQAHYPGERYESYRDAIQSVADFIQDMEENLIEVKLNLTTLNSTMNSFTNLRFDTEETKDNLQNMTNTLEKNKATLQKLVSKYRNSESILRAVDGQLLSPNETITETKSRFHEMNKIMDDFDTTLRLLNQSRIELGKELSSNAGKISSIANILEQFNMTIENASDVMKKSKDIETSVSDVLKGLSNEKQYFVLSRNSIGELYENYPNTTNPYIEDIRDTLHNLLRDQEMRIGNLSNIANKSQDALNNSIRKLLNYSKILSDSYSDPDALAEVISSFIGIKADIVNIMNKTKESFPYINGELDNTRLVNSDIRNYIQQLDIELIDQNKQNFISRHGPELENQLSKLKKKHTRAQANVMSSNNTLQTLNDLFKDVSSLLMSEATVNITLNKTRALLQDGERITMDDAAMVLDLEIPLSQINIEILDPMNTPFKNNNTFGNIESMFNNINESLISIDGSVQAIITNHQEVGNYSNDILRYLLDLKNETDTFQRLRENISRTEVSFASNDALFSIADTNISALTFGINKLSNDIRNMSTKYSNVKDTTLQNEASDLLDSIDSVVKNSNVLTEDLKTLKQQHNLTGTLLNHVDNILASIVSSPQELQERNDVINLIQSSLNENLSSIDPRTTALIDNITMTQNTLLLQTQQFDNLRQRFRKQQIYEYINNSFPQVLEMYSEVNRTLSNMIKKKPVLETLLDVLNNTVTETEIEISPYSNILLNMTHHKQNHKRKQHVFLGLNKNITDIMKQVLDIENLITASIIDNETLDDVQDRFRGYGNILVKIGTDIGNISKQLMELENDTSQSYENISAIKDEVTDLRNNYETLDNVLKEVNNLKKVANETLTSVNTGFYLVNDVSTEFKNVTDEYSNVHNDEIQYHVSELSKALEETGDISNSSKNNALGELKTIEEVHSKVKMLYRNISANVTDLISLMDLNRKLRKQIPTLKTNLSSSMNTFKHEIPSQLAGLNNRVDAHKKSLESLKEMIRRYIKNDTLLNSLPELRTMWNSLESGLINLAENTNETKAKISGTIEYLKEIDLKINRIPTVNISTNNFHSSLINNNNLADEIYNTIIEAQSTLKSLPVLNIDVDAFVTNENISVSDVIRLIESINTTLKGIELKQKEAGYNGKDLYATTSVIENELIRLDQTVLAFKNTDDSLKNVSVLYSQVSGNKNATQKKLSAQKESITNLREIIEQLNKNYSEYNYNMSGLDNLLNNTEYEIENLHLEMIKASDNIKNVGREIANMNKDLHNGTSSIDDLDSKVATITSRINNTNMVIVDTGALIDTISQGIPEVNYSIDRIEQSIQSINASLVEEKLKSSHYNQTTPHLEDKYNDIQQRIGETNSTLKFMETYIGNLNKTLKTLRNKIGAFNNLNIPTTEIVSNITYLENRLAIMTDNHNNVQEIMHQVRLDMDQHSVLGPNISLEQVQSQLHEFNKSMDWTVEILNGIDTEAVEMEMHFDDLNDTMVDINRTIETFKNRLKQSKSLHNDIDGLKYQIDEASEDIENMQQSVRNLTDIFAAMQNKYDAVFNRTSKNTTLFVNHLTDVDRKLSDINKVILEGQRYLNESIERFDEMNSTMFKDINSIAELIKTISHVKDSQDDLKEYLRQLEESVSNFVSNNTSINNIISGLTTTLNELEKNLKLEQQKHDFLQENFVLLESKMEKMLGPIDNTNKSVTNATTYVNETLDGLIKLSMELKKHPNLNINLSNQYDTIVDSKGILKKLQNTLTDVEGKSGILKDNVSSLIHSEENVTEIKLMYNKLNKSIDQLNDDIININTLLNTTTRVTTHVSDLANNISKGVDMMITINKSLLEEQNNTDELISKIKNQSSVLSDVYSMAQNISNRLSGMSLNHKTLNDTRLQSKLEYLLNKVSSEIHEIEKLQETYNNLTRQARELASFEDTAITSLKNSSIDDIDYLFDVVTKGNHSVYDIKRRRRNITATQTRLADRLEALTVSILNMTTEADQLNRNFTMETEKRLFISKVHPAMKEKINQMAMFINDTADNLNDAMLYNQATNTSLGRLAKKMDAVKQINISLDDERGRLKQLNEKTYSSAATYQNMSRLLSEINIDQLLNTNISIGQLQTVFDNIDSQVEFINRTLNDVNDQLSDISDAALLVQGSLNGINDTVTHFMEVDTKLRSVATTGAEVTDMINQTYRSTADFTEQLQDIDNLYKNVVSTFVHIKDGNITKNKDILDKMIGSSKSHLTDLTKAIQTLQGEHKIASNNITDINETLSDTKFVLDQLKDHITKVNRTSNHVESAFIDMKNSHGDLNISLSTVPKEFKKIKELIKELNKTYSQEQDKIEFITEQAPIAESRYKDLQKLLNLTNMNLSHAKLQLADLKYDIGSIAEELEKVAILNFTTDLESLTWNDLHSTVKTLFKSFTAVSGEYSDVLSSITRLKNKSGNVSDLISKYKEFNTTIENLERRTQGINRVIDDIKARSKDASEDLKGFRVIINKVKDVNLIFKDTGLKLDSVQNTSNLVDKILNSSNSTLSNMSSMLNTMKQMYAPLANKEWDKMQANISQNLEQLINKEKTLSEKYIPLGNQEKWTTQSHDSTAAVLETSKLTKQNANDSLSSIEKSIQSDKKNLLKIEPPLQIVHEQAKELDGDIHTLMDTLQVANKSLHEELQKFNFINNALPGTQSKHTNTNASFVANLPKVDQMKGQIQSLVELVNRIKSKMVDFGLEDTNYAVKSWDSLILKLNTSFNTVIAENNKSKVALERLRTDLWKSSPHYSAEESLENLRTRFERYNSTLEEIKTSAHSILINLGNLTAEAEEAYLMMSDTDAGLTTTPGTTTPSGPPDWLTFTSSGTGTLGKDTGFVQCSVNNLDQWSVMKIVRQHEDGSEVAVAAWMVGRGARKALRDRRISVQKSEDGAGGGKMTVTIRSLQCEDEGIYLCFIDTYAMWPLQAGINIVTPAEDNLRPDFPTEVFEDKIANLSCSGHPGYPAGKISWKVKHEGDLDFKPFSFYSERKNVQDTDCIRTELSQVEYQFDMSWNNTQIRCTIDNTDYYAEGVIRLLPYDICNRVRYLGTIGHPYTPHKYIVCGKELNIMECPGKTCYDDTEENCVQCKASHGGGDPCLGQPLFSYVAHENDCKKYYICMGPTKTVKTCSKGYFQPHVPGNCIMSYQQSYCGQAKG